MSTGRVDPKQVLKLRTGNYYVHMTPVNLKKYLYLKNSNFFVPQNTWIRARATCRHLGMDLAILRTETEISDITEHLDSRYADDCMLMPTSL
jgi:hypothetical protein